MAAEFGHQLHVILYQDGATTGNLLSHDPAKAMELYYITFEELGNNRICMNDFWITFCLVRTRVVKTIRGGISAVTAALTLKLQEMADGIVVQGPRPNDKLHFFVNFGYFLSDESAQHNIFRFKGQRAPICHATVEGHNQRTLILGRLARPPKGVPQIIPSTVFPLCFTTLDSYGDASI